MRYELRDMSKKIRLFRSENELELYLINKSYRKKFPDMKMENLWIYVHGRIDRYLSVEDYLSGGMLSRND